MHQLQIPLGQLPVNLVLLSNGCVVFIKVASFDVIFDQAPEGVDAVFMDDHFIIDGEEHSYNTMYEYKHIPGMLKWLQQQNLQEPVVMFG
jgi:hypothetical protein